jgi:D-3-phosphoglycerate dehydrogenase / 2-oxoglutarate reductase
VSPTRTVLVTGESLVPPAALRLIRDRGYVVRRVDAEKLDAEDLHRALEGVAGYLIGGHEELLAEHVEAATGLEAVAWVGTDFEANVPGWRRAFELGVAVVNAPGANAVAVAEFTMLMILTLARPFVDQVFMPGVQPSGPPSPGRELRGGTLGLIGAGRIGARVAAIAGAGFGMRVSYHAPRRNEALEQAAQVTYRDRDELLAGSDVVSLHRRGPAPDEGPELGARELDLLRPGALLVNTVHPRLVDPDALLRVTLDKGVRSAFDGVGPQWHGLVALGPPRFVGMPQMGFHTVDANLRASLSAAESVCDVLDGRPARWVNNPDFAQRRRRRLGPTAG